MSAGMVGYILGGTMASLLVPVLILISARFIAPLKRNPRVVYPVCAVLVLLVCSLGPSVSGEWLAAAISAVLALLFLWWGYRRDARAVLPPRPAPSSPARRKGTDY